VNSCAYVCACLYVRVCPISPVVVYYSHQHLVIFVISVSLYARVCPFSPVVVYNLHQHLVIFVISVSLYARVCPFSPVVVYNLHQHLVILHQCEFVCACVPISPCGGLLSAITPCDLCNQSEFYVCVRPFSPVEVYYLHQHLVIFHQCEFVCACVTIFPCGGLLSAPAPCDLCNQCELYVCVCAPIFFCGGLLSAPAPCDLTSV